MGHASSLVSSPVVSRMIFNPTVSNAHKGTPSNRLYACLLTHFVTTTTHKLALVSIVLQAMENPVSRATAKLFIVLFPIAKLQIQLATAFPASVDSISMPQMRVFLQTHSAQILIRLEGNACHVLVDTPY
jgi:hypothetical protein